MRNFLHHLVSHPIAGLLWLLGFEKAGDEVHDASSFQVAGSVLLLVLVSWFVVVKTPSPQQVFNQADAEAAKHKAQH